MRGDARAAYHNHIVQATASEVRAAAPDAGLRLDTVGEWAGRPRCLMAACHWRAIRLAANDGPAATCTPGMGESAPGTSALSVLANPLPCPLPPPPLPPSPGGGRIEHYSQQRALSVFGFSSAFGQAPHHVTAALLRGWLPLHDITASYEGY